MYFTIFIIVCIIGVFIVCIIFISFSEVSARHSRCQFAIVTSMIVNGFYNPRNGNQYAGLTTIQRHFQNLNTELQKLNTLTVTAACNNIINANLAQYPTTAFSQLRTIYNTYYNTNVQLPSGGLGSAPSTNTLNWTLNDDIKNEFSSILQYANGITTAA